MRLAPAAVGAAALALAPALAAVAPPRIVVGPNMLVSRDGDLAHCETAMAANPRDPGNLLGASIVLGRPDGSSLNKPYVSFDGGASWTDITLPEEMEQGGIDPQVGFGPTGTAYFVGLSREMNFYRSKDGGRTWSAALALGKRHDHEMLAVDQTTGAFAGRVYIADQTDDRSSGPATEADPRRRVVLFRSSDDGQSFIGPVEVAKGEGRVLAVYNLLVLSDGTLFVPMAEYPNFAVEKDATTFRILFALSTDGGVTFSPKRPIGEVFFGGVRAAVAQQKSGRVDQIGGPVFAVDPGGRFRDRLYAAWIDAAGDRLNVLLSYSADRGATWSRPTAVDAAATSDASLFQPVIATNSDGVLGVLFYSTEGFPRRDRFDVYFTGSLDGGETFLPKTRVSGEASHPFGEGNARPGPHVTNDRGLVVLFLLSGLTRWPNGGDYIGMTADADGVFHPFWPDGRSGTYQLYTARIRVATEAPGKLPALEKAVLSEQVTLVFDPTQYDRETREVRMPVRLKNTSKQALYPPFVVEVKEVAHPYTVKSGEPINAPTFLNASNGKKGVGATFDYSKTLGGLEALEPEQVTDAIVWRFEAESPVKTDFYLGTEITGFVAKKEEKK